MRNGLYLRLALAGLHKNRRLYGPYLLTGSVMVMMYDLLANLCDSPTLLSMAGGSVLSSILPLGCVVVAVFSLLFLLYTHTFLIRQRSAEFGLYNVLGMGKTHLARILAWETLFTGLATLVCGLVLGIAFSKLSELALLRILRLPTGYDVTVSLPALAHTALFFVAVNAVLLLRAVWRIFRLNTLSLLHEGRAGEKPPKANWLMALLGLVCLGAAYCLAIMTRNPGAALMCFFVAVLLVIAATYLLFLSGSVALCRVLQKNRRYYYKASHFISVSSMMYRMRRTGAGLASICILSTMVLVMLSSTTSLFVGTEGVLHNRYPFQWYVRCTADSLDQLSASRREAIHSAEAEMGVTQSKAYRAGELTGYFGKNGLVTDMSALGDAASLTLADEAFLAMGMSRIGYLEVVPLEDYNRMTGSHETLAADECLLYASAPELAAYDSFTIANQRTFRVQKTLDSFPTLDGDMAVSIFPWAVLVTDSFDEVVETFLPQRVNGDHRMLQLRYVLGFDSSLAPEVLSDAAQSLRAALNEAGAGDFTVRCRDLERQDFYIMYGSLFFLGIMLSVAFLLAAVLIIYYKQLSEGYEDQARFANMQKVGMTKTAIRKSVNAQMLTVFFLPLGLAGVHLAFAFPMVWQLLRAFGQTNLWLIIRVNVASYLAFCLFYVIVYKLTANTYFGIVSGSRSDI